MLKIDRLSAEYIRVPVRWDVPGTGPQDPTALPVEVAFRSASDGTVTWLTASWDGTTELAGLTWHVAKVLVGGAAADLAPGTYDVLVRVTASPQAPVRSAGPLRVL